MHHTNVTQLTTLPYKAIEVPMTDSQYAAHVVVRFYGEHSSMWVRPEDLTPVEVTVDSHLDRLSAMRSHPKLKHK